MTLGGGGLDVARWAVRASRRNLAVRIAPSCESSAGEPGARDDVEMRRKGASARRRKRTEDQKKNQTGARKARTSEVKALEGRRAKGEGRILSFDRGLFAGPINSSFFFFFFFLFFFSFFLDFPFFFPAFSSSISIHFPTGTRSGQGAQDGDEFERRVVQCSTCTADHLAHLASQFLSAKSPSSQCRTNSLSGLVQARPANDGCMRSRLLRLRAKRGGPAT